MSCPPDNDAKRLTRFYLYRRIKNLWKAGGTPNGSALVLSGYEASEVGCLRDYLGFSATKTIFADIDSRGLEIVQQAWKGVHVYKGKIENAISSSQDDFALINFDFCGYMNREVEKSVQASVGKFSSR